MLKQYHPISLNVVRGTLAKTGFQVKRIRTLKSPTEYYDFDQLEVEFDGTGEANWNDWCPADVWAWVSNSFTAGDIEAVAIEYRDYTWFARIWIIGADEKQRRAGRLSLLDGLANELPPSVGEPLPKLALDKNDFPF